jgi:putative chitinase
MNLDKLKGQVSDTVINQIPDVSTKFGINTPLRLAHFLGQCSHESGGFKSVSENLNYSAKRLLEIFPKYFKQPGLAESYARKPELIASRVYGGRMGNGPEPTREGYKFRGRGYLQCTGKSNYAEFDKFVDEDILANPDLVATKYPLVSAAWFFHKNGLVSICDRGISTEVITQLTKRINGGIIGLDHRLSETNKFAKILGVV